jgi:hypothetical protein
MFCLHLVDGLSTCLGALAQVRRYARPCVLCAVPEATINQKAHESRIIPENPNLLLREDSIHLDSRFV